MSNIDSLFAALLLLLLLLLAVVGKSVSHHHRHSTWQKTEQWREYGDTGMMEMDWAIGTYGDTGVTE